MLEKVKDLLINRGVPVWTFLAVIVLLWVFTRGATKVVNKLESASAIQDTIGVDSTALDSVGLLTDTVGVDTIDVDSTSAVTDTVDVDTTKVDTLE